MEEKAQDFARLQTELEQARRQLRRKDVELKAVLAQSQEISSTDALTYLPNRRKIVGCLQQEILRANRYRTALSASVVDIDRFKAINDSHGHAVGDEVLRAVASEMRQTVRESDLVGRLGGEEFLILLPNTPLAAAGEQAARLCQSVRALRIRAEHREISVTISVGVAEYRIGEEIWENLLRRADAVMYQAKAAGRDRYSLDDSRTNE